MPDPTMFRLKATLTAADSTLVLRIMSILHRRGVAVVKLSMSTRTADFDMSAPSGGVGQTGAVEVLFESTDQRASIVFETMDSTVGLEGVLVEPLS